MSSQDSEVPGWAEENKGPRIIVVTTTITGIASLFVLGRLYSRLVTVRRLGIDDFLVAFSIILGWAYVALAVVAINSGAGRHAATLDLEDLQNAIFITVVSFMPGVLSFTIPKFAVVILLAKLLNPGRLHKVFMWCGSVLYGLIVAGMLIINFAQCNPPKKQWDVYGTVEGTCVDRKFTVNYAFATGVASVLFDFYLAIYPTVVLARLQMKWTKKLGLSMALGFGFCAGGVTIHKCRTLPGLLHLTDFTFAVDDVVLWTNIEANCVLIGACIPCMAPLVKALFGASFLGGSTPAYKPPSGSSNPVVTIGSSGFKNKFRRKGLGTSRLDSIDGTESRDIILEEREVTVTYTQNPHKDAAEGKEFGSGRLHAAEITRPDW